MENQYCRVGAVTPITSGHHAIAIIENRYRYFLEKAANLKGSDSRLLEFFEHKAHNFKKLLEELVK